MRELRSALPLRPRTASGGGSFAVVSRATSCEVAVVALIPQPLLPPVMRQEKGSTTVSGVCATRLQAQRVNLLPDALEVVLSEGSDDSAMPGRAGRNTMREFLRLVLNTMPSMASGSGFRLSCDDRADWNPVPVPGRIATTGTLRDPAFASEQCSERATCEALRPADAQPMGMPCPSP